MEYATMTLNIKFAAYLKGKEHRDTQRGYDPPRWISERRVLEDFYREGFHGRIY